MSYREFCEANKKKKKNKDTLCLAYKSMIDFEKEYPKVAEKYFDLKYEKLKINNKNLQVV